MTLMIFVAVCVCVRVFLDCFDCVDLFDGFF